MSAVVVLNKNFIMTDYLKNVIVEKHFPKCKYFEGPERGCWTVNDVMSTLEDISSKEVLLIDPPPLLVALLMSHGKHRVNILQRDGRFNWQIFTFNCN